MDKVYLIRGLGIKEGSWEEGEGPSHGSDGESLRWRTFRRSEGLWIWRQRTSRGEQEEVSETELPDGAVLDRGSHIPRSLFEFGRKR